MLKDSYDKTLWALMALTVIALAVLLSGQEKIGRSSRDDAGLDKALARQIAYQARVDFLMRQYGPVETLRREGNLTAALLKLDELNRSYPNEAHGFILKGEILAGMGTLDEAVVNFARGIRLNGDYLDRKSPLSRRPEIQKVADDALRVVGDRARANPGNRSTAESLKNINYLRSRLAGGCE